LADHGIRKLKSEKYGNGRAKSTATRSPIRTIKPVIPTKKSLATPVQKKNIENKFSAPNRVRGSSEKH